LSSFLSLRGKNKTKQSKTKNQPNQTNLSFKSEQRTKALLSLHNISLEKQLLNYLSKFKLRNQDQG
jgi:hypothetical protein